MIITPGDWYQLQRLFSSYPTYRYPNIWFTKSRTDLVFYAWLYGKVDCEVSCSERLINFKKSNIRLRKCTYKVRLCQFEAKTRKLSEFKGDRLYYRMTSLTAIICKTK